jgi:hypothetical protein
MSANEKKPMTIAEAGRLGGRANLAKRGNEFYRVIGKKGGDAVKAARGLGFYEAIGAKGGNAVKAKDPDHFKRIGKLGGEKVREAMALLRAQKTGGTP